MRGDIIFRVYGVHEGREKDVLFVDFRTREEAQTQIGQLRLRVTNEGIGPIGITTRGS